MFGHMNGYGWGGMGLGMLLWWLAIAIALVMFVRYVTSSGNDNPKSARKILDERYSRGEIGREEYEQKKRDLEN